MLLCPPASSFLFKEGFMKSSFISRRRLIKSGALLLPGSTLWKQGPVSDVPRKAVTVRDHFWLWAHPAGSYNGPIPGDSRITPMEASYYMSIPNMVSVHYNGKPQPPYDRYAFPFRAARETVWDLLWSAEENIDSAAIQKDHETILELVERNSNCTGVILDDFFSVKKQGRSGALSPEELRDLQRRLEQASKKINLWFVLYGHQLDEPISEHLKYCDILTYWTWHESELGQLESNFDRAKKLCPDLPVLLGCYMWDHGDGKPMSVTSMQKQCQLGLRWLKQGRVQGMIFLASCICDLELETVEWARNWIREVGDQKLKV